MREQNRQVVKALETERAKVERLTRKSCTISSARPSRETVSIPPLYTLTSVVAGHFVSAFVCSMIISIWPSFAFATDNPFRTPNRLLDSMNWLICDSLPVPNFPPELWKPNENSPIFKLVQQPALLQPEIKPDHLPLSVRASGSLSRGRTACSTSSTTPAGTTRHLHCLVYIHAGDAAYCILFA